MSTLTTLRADLEAVLTGAGLHVKDHVPERLTPPLALIGAGSPYAEAGEAFGTFAVRFTVFLVAARATNLTATRELDALVTTAVATVTDAPGWGVERLDQPSTLQANNTEYLATTLDVVTQARLDAEGD